MRFLVLKMMVVGLFGFLMLSHIVGIGGSESALSESVSLRIVHSPIVIEGDSELRSFAAAEGLQGDGTSANPIVIGSMAIDGDGGHRGIYVGNTSLFFIIEDIEVKNVSAESDSEVDIGSGILLNNVSHASVLNSSTRACPTGLTLIDCSDSMVERLTVLNASLGMAMLRSDHISVSHSSLDAGVETGMYLRHVCNSTIDHNTIVGLHYGMQMRSCLHNEISDNLCTGSLGAAIQVDSWNYQISGASRWNNI